MKHILANWNIAYDDVIQVQQNVWCINDSFYLKFYDNKAFNINLQICKLLREHNIPAPEVISTVRGNDCYTYDGMFYYLTRKMEGNHLNEEDILNDMTKARAIGNIVAKLHNSFAVITDEFELYDNDLVNELNGWIKDNIEKYAKGSFAHRIFRD